VRALLSELKRALCIAEKDLKEYYLKPPTISWGLVFPFTFALAFTLRGRSGPWLAPSLITLSLFFGSTSMSAASIVFERRMGSFERLLLYPISYTGIVFGKVLSSFFFGLLSSSATFAIIWMMFLIKPCYPLLLVVSIIGATFQFSALGVLLSFAVKDPSQAMTVFNSVRLPMMFLCGLIIPFSRLPPWLRYVSLLLPPTYATESIKYAFAGSYELLPPTIAIVSTYISFVIILYVTAYFIKRSIP